MTRPADPTQVPHPGEVESTARPFGRGAHPVMPALDDGDPQPITQTPGTAPWTARIMLEAGPHRIVASVGTSRDVVGILIRDDHDIPRRGVPVAPGRDIHSIGARPDHGIAGTRPGPDKNGTRR